MGVVSLPEGFAGCDVGEGDGVTAGGREVVGSPGSDSCAFQHINTETYMFIHS